MNLMHYGVNLDRVALITVSTSKPEKMYYISVSARSASLVRYNGHLFSKLNKNSRFRAPNFVMCPLESPNLQYMLSNNYESF